ncbi:MAG: type II toxin-antitoxin system VapC family toxin [Candidatus Sulfotelmatobacter sp.]
MSRFVLDASVGLAWFLDDPVPDLATKVRQSLRHGSRALVPALWVLEMANGLVTVERRGSLATSFIDRCLSDIEGLLSSVIDHSASAISVRQAFSVANASRLTAYDATYLELARTEHLPLATLDRALVEAAKKAGIPLFP